MAVESLYDSFQFLWSTTTNRIWFSTSHLFLISNITNLIQTPQYKTNLPSFSSVLTVHKRKRRKFQSKGVIKDFAYWTREKKNNAIKEKWILIFICIKYPQVSSNPYQPQKSTKEILTNDFLFLEVVAQKNMGHLRAPPIS